MFTPAPPYLIETNPLKEHDILCELFAELSGRPKSFQLSFRCAHPRAALPTQGTLLMRLTL
jgi:hypothetical protein